MKQHHSEPKQTGVFFWHGVGGRPGNEANLLLAYADRGIALSRSKICLSVKHHSGEAITFL